MEEARDRREEEKAVVKGAVVRVGTWETKSPRSERDLSGYRITLQPMEQS